MKHNTWGQLLQQSRDPADALDVVQVGDEEDSDTEEESNRRDKDDLDRERAIQRTNVVYTRFLVAASFVCGVVTSQRGPSILDLADVTHASLQSAASLFALGALGHALGSAGAGLLLGRLGGSICLFWGMLGMCGTTAALPWCAGYGIMAALYCLSLVCVGGVETGSYAEIAKRWGSQGGSKVQLLQLWYVVGGVVSPGMTQFFLANRNRHHHHHTHLENVTSGSNDIAQPASEWRLNTTLANTIVEYTSVSNESQQPDNTADGFNSRVEIAYFITGALALLVSIPFLVTYFLRKDPPLVAPPPGSKKRDTLTTTVLSSPLLQVRDANIPVLLLVAVFIFLVTAVEESLHQFLFSFMIHEARWATSAAAWVTTWFWSGVLLVRAVTYFFPDQLGDGVILALSCAALPCTLAGLHTSIVLSHDSNGVWACVFFAGMAISLIFPVSFKWMLTSLAQRSSAVSGVVMSASFLAGIVNPLVLGYFLDSGRYLGFTFLLTAQAVLALLLFLLLHVLSRRLTARWRGVATRKSIHVTAPGRLEEEEEEVRDEKSQDSDT